MIFVYDNELDDAEQSQKLPKPQFQENELIAMSKYNRRERNRQNMNSKLKIAPQFKKDYEIDDVLENAMLDY